MVNAILNQVDSMCSHRLKLFTTTWTYKKDTTLHTIGYVLHHMKVISQT